MAAQSTQHLVELAEEIVRDYPDNPRIDVEQFDRSTLEDVHELLKDVIQEQDTEVLQSDEPVDGIDWTLLTTVRRLVYAELVASGLTPHTGEDEEG